MSLFPRDLAQNLSDIGDPTSSYATGGISFELTAARKFPHSVKSSFDKAEIQSRSSFIVRKDVPQFISSGIIVHPSCSLNDTSSRIV